MSRIESPSSITTYNACPRKYYYSYKLALPKKESISTLTGKAVHSALESFFKIDTSNINKYDFELILKHHVVKLFNDAWVTALPELMKLENDKETIRDHYHDSMFMLQNFIEDFLDSIKRSINGITFQEAFNKLKPQTEVYLYSEKHNVRGYLDAILNINGEFYIMDYKTSSRDEVTDDYHLQLAIYTMMFKEKFNKLPNKVGLHFLRHGTKKFIDVNEGLIQEAAKQCELIRLNTESEDINDYPKNPGYYCKWKSGECSFYSNCFGVIKLSNFDNNLIEIKKE